MTSYFDPNRIIPLILACALTAASGPFDGTWAGSPTADCARPGERGGALSISGESFLGEGTECRMTRPVNVRDMEAVLYDMQCTAEQRTWSDRAMLMAGADGGLIMVWDGYAFAYRACPTDPAAGTVTTADEIGISD